MSNQQQRARQLLASANRGLSANFTGAPGQQFTDSVRLSERINKFDRSNYFGANEDGAVDYLQSDATYTMKIVAGDAPIKLALHPGYFRNVSDINASRGMNLDAIITEGVIKNTSGVTIGSASGEPYSIIEFIQFTRFVPQQFVHLKMLVDDEEQFVNIIQFDPLTPYRSLGNTRINPGQYKDARQSNNRIADIPLPNCQFSNQTLVTTKIAANRTVTFILSVGATLNTAAILAKDAEQYAPIIAGAVAK